MALHHGRHIMSMSVIEHQRESRWTEGMKTSKMESERTKFPSNVPTICKSHAACTSCNVRAAGAAERGIAD